MTVTLKADGKNWKDWNKQILNCAAADGASALLQGQDAPPYDETDARYKTYNLLTPVLQATMTNAEIGTELKRVEDHNKYLRPLNKDARQLQDVDRIARERWVTRDARLQNLILSSIDKSLTPQVRSATAAYDMYMTLKELNNSSDHANAQLAWIAFVDLRADSCRSVREYIGKFRETINDLATQGISLRWHKPSQLTDAGAATNSLEELMVIHMLHGLSKVIPQWVEDRNNDLRQGNLWTIDTLISSVEDHIRHGNEDPVKAFTTIAKQQEEKRVLQRLNQHQNTTRLPFTPQPPAFCTHCDREHAGGTDNCWKAHPHLMPHHLKARGQTQTPPATPSTANVTVATPQAASSGYSNHVYASIATFVSPNLLSKAANDKQYKQRYCYDTAANRHVFNNRSRFTKYTPITARDVHGSTGSTTAKGVGTACLSVVKSDGTVQEIHLTNVLYCPNFATNVISQAPFKRKGAWYHSGKDKLYTVSDEELAYLPEIDGIPNLLIVTNPSKASAALRYASNHAYRRSANEPSTTRSVANWHHTYRHAKNKTPKKSPPKKPPGSVIPSDRLATSATIPSFSNSTSTTSQRFTWPARTATPLRTSLASIR
jgi:hypothetical protein